MLYEFLVPLADVFQPFNLFRYITFRTGGAMMTAMLVCFLFGGPYIRWLKTKQSKGQPIRSDGPERHIVEKAGTPTMGGLLILAALVGSSLIWGDLSNPYLWVVMSVTLGFGAIGFIDDYRKVTQHTTEGLGGKAKLALEFMIAAAAVFAIMQITSGAEGAPPGYGSSLAFPFFKDALLNLGLFFIVFGMLFITFFANAVNLTDGLDGLAIAPVMITAICFGVIAYLVGNFVFSGYLQLNFMPGVGELAVFFGAMIGAGLGFLWWNAPPAMVFMGDTGSLSLGGALGSAAVVVKHEIVLAIIGGLFVLEAVSVMVQVASFKLTGKRVFRMAPIHHHFEKLGWPEPTIVIRFWIIAVVLALIGLSTLKLR